MKIKTAMIAMVFIFSLPWLAWGAFPSTLTNAVDGETEMVAAHLNNLEAKVGVNNSSVTTSLDYMLRHGSSIDPGHKHTPAYGGTGIYTYAVGDLLYANGATTLSKLADVATGQVLISGGVATAPAWSAAPALTTSLTVPTLYGSVAENGDLTLHGTSHATKTTSYVLLQPTSGNVGIGTSTPASLFHAATSTTATGIFTGEQASADADSFDQIFRKARGTVGTPTVITTADELGTVQFRGYSGAGGYVTGAAIKGISEGTIATTRVPGHLSFWTGTDAAPTVLTERLRIDSAGNIGFGVTALGTSAVKVFGAGSGTAPSTFPADMAQFVVKDQAAGNACFHFYTELGQIIKLYQQANIVAAKTDYTAGDLDTEAEIITALNATNTKLNAILTILQNNGLMAAP